MLWTLDGKKVIGPTGRVVRECASVDDAVALKADLEHRLIQNPNHNAGPVVALLQTSLTDLIDLSLIGKATHWSMQGGLATGSYSFLGMHQALDEIIDFARDEYDTVAERIIQLGYFPDARVATVSGATPFRQNAAGPVPVADAVSYIASVLELAATRFDGRMKTSADDLVTQNLFIDISTKLQKFSWFWQAELPRS